MTKPAVAPKAAIESVPREHIDRLVLNTVIEPLHREWQETNAAARAEMQTTDKHGWKSAVQICRDFLYKLTRLIVLDPACGTGTALSVAFTHMKRLEIEVHETMASLAGSHQSEIEPVEFQVNPGQFLGLDINPHAAAVAERTLWDAWLQWQLKCPGSPNLPTLVRENCRNIEIRDALLEYDRREPILNKQGQPITRWDGKTLKPHPTTGQPVPDHNFRVPVWNHINPRKAQWPPADFIVSKLPFQSATRMGDILGDSYTKAIRAAHPEVPDSADFAMYWWNHAASILRAAPDTRLRRFGFITTGNLRQPANRRVLQHHMDAHHDPVALAFAMPAIPCPAAPDEAPRHIAITVACSASIIKSHSRRINPDLTTGAPVYQAQPLLSNTGISSPGVKLNGSGFIVTQSEAKKLGLGTIPGVENIIRPYRNGSDITQDSRDVMVIDLFGHTAEETAEKYPEIYQWLHDQVKSERDASRDKSIKAAWWLHGQPRPELRKMLTALPRYITTAKTSKHRFFVFLDHTVLPDNVLVNIALSDAWHLGVLSSRFHGTYARAAADPFDERLSYDRVRCFETFPFPTPTAAQAARIGDIAERLDAHRKKQQALHPRLTLTMCYNVLEIVRAGEALTPKYQAIYDHGQLDILRQIHDDLDSAVAEAYGWPADLTDQQILTRLVELNKQRAAEEAKGKVRHLRPVPAETPQW